jgi:hypothetical protein
MNTTLVKYNAASGQTITTAEAIASFDVSAPVYLDWESIRDSFSLPVTHYVDRLSP